jgi:hypothetical protein
MRKRLVKFEPDEDEGGEVWLRGHGRKRKK